MILVGLFVTNLDPEVVVSGKRERCGGRGGGGVEVEGNSIRDHHDFVSVNSN